MSFYREWKGEYENKKNCNSYIKQFLEKAPQTISELLSGTNEDLKCAYDIISEVPLKLFLNVLLTIRLDRDVKASEIPQYSSFSDGVCRIPELLEFYPDGESFVNLGYQMVNAPNEAANRKYGENHSRLAESLNLVTVTKSKPRYAKNTAWGSYLVQYTFEEKENLFKKLLLREYFLQSILQRAFQGPTSYFEIVSFLAESTATRRRSNTHHLLDYILKGTEWECYLDNIEWK